MRIKVFLETVKIKFLLLAVKKPLVSEKEFDVILAKWDTVLDYFRC